MLLLGFKKINMLHNTYCFICFCFLFWKLHQNNDFQQKSKRQWLFVRSAFNMSNVIIMASCYSLLHPLTLGRLSKDGCLTKPDSFLLPTSTFIVRLNHRSLCNVNADCFKGLQILFFELVSERARLTTDFSNKFYCHRHILMIPVHWQLLGCQFSTFLSLYSVGDDWPPPPPSVSSDHHVIPSDYRPPTLSATNSHFHICMSPPH